MKEKVENFWYHYKGITIAVIFAVIILVIGFKSCAEKTVPDLKMLYFSDSYISSDNSEIMEKELRDAKLVKDIDGDGNAEFYMDIVLYGFDVESDTDEGTISKIQAVMYAGDHTIALVHKYALEDYPGFFEDVSAFAKEDSVTFTDAETGYVSGVSLKGNTFLEKCGIDTENLYLAMRRRTQSQIEKGEYEDAFKLAEETANYILSFNEVAE